MAKVVKLPLVVANYALQVNTKTTRGNQVAKHAPQENTKMKLEPRMIVNHVPLVPFLNQANPFVNQRVPLEKDGMSSLSTMNARVATVATVWERRELPRPPSVERG